MEALSLKNLTHRAKLKVDTDGTFLPKGQAAKSGVNKSLLDAAHGQFAHVLKYVAIKKAEAKKKATHERWGIYQHTNKVHRLLLGRFQRQQNTAISISVQ